MNYASEFSISNSGECIQDLHSVELSSKRALERINILYNEIMRPVDIEFNETILAGDGGEETSDRCQSNQNHYLKSCCTTLRELCSKCESCILRCQSCNQCNCTYAAKLNKNKTELCCDSEKSSQQSLHKNKNNSTRCTKPEPFSFLDKDTEWLKARENKLEKIRKDLDKKIDNELKKKIHSKPVPKSTHLPLYNQMVQTKQERNTQRKEKCIEILSNTKPFDLHYKNKEKSKSSLILTDAKVSNFKAKPVPKNILSNKISEKLKNKEQVRRMLINERAQQLIENSSLPFSQRNITRSLSMINMDAFSRPNNKDYSKKNISEITKRLYVLKCNDTLNSWNERVTKVNDCEKLLKTDSSYKMENKVASTEQMPFLYFPVRMSNAALLREKQIRERMSTRNLREKIIQMTDMNKKKINQEIAHKLRRLIPSTECDKEINEKVKNYRESQYKRQEEYDKELEEIMTRVAEQSLLLERIQKINKKGEKNSSPHKLKDNGSESNESTPPSSEAIDVKDESNKSTFPSSEVEMKDSESNCSPAINLNTDLAETYSSASEISYSAPKSKESSSVSKSRENENDV